MAKVTAAQRKKTKKRSGTTKYPMETAAQIRSAIRLRGHSKATKEGGKVSSSTVLSRAGRAISRMVKAGKMSASTAKGLRAKIKAARAADRAKK